MGDGERDEACEAENLIDEGHDVRQLWLVVEGRELAAVHDFVHLLLKTCLQLRVPA